MTVEVNLSVTISRKKIVRKKKILFNEAVESPQV